MFPYLTMLMVPSFFSVTGGKRLSTVLWGMTFLLFVIFVGLRFEVGPDWGSYARMHSFLQYQDIFEALTQTESFSYLLFWVSTNTGFHVYLTNVVAAIILLFGVFSFACRTFNPWLALVSATPYFIFVFGMSGIRQAMAAGVMLFLLSQWERFSFMKRGAYILVAALFHTSALVNSVFLVTQMHIRLLYKVLLSGLILLLTFYIGTSVPLFSENMLKYQERYIDNPESRESFGSLYHIGLILIPAVLGLMFRKRISENIHNQQLFKFGLYAPLCVFAINFIDFFSTTLASRLTIYLYFVPMMIYPALVPLFGKKGKVLMTFAIILFHVLVLVTWFTFGNHAYRYIPYQNVLFNLDQL